MELPVSWYRAIYRAHNSTINLKYSLLIPSQTSIQIYDLSGRLFEDLVQRQLPAGSHSVTWATENYSSGIYLVRMKTHKFSEIRKIVLTK